MAEFCHGHQEHGRQERKCAADLLRQLEKSYEDKRGYWKHGGLVGVMGYGGGVIGRYSALPEEFPGVSHFHTVRVNQPSGWFYTTDTLREIMDIWEEHGSGLTNMHGSTGDMVLLGTRTEELEPIFRALTEKGWDLGGSGSDLRTPSCCVGPARCENACYDTLAMTYNLTQELPGRAAPPHVQLQVQDQDVRLPERLHRGHRPFRHGHHRYLEGRHQGRSG